MSEEDDTRRSPVASPPPAPPSRSPGGEKVVVAALFLSALASIAFVVVYIVDADTQFLGLTLGLVFAFLAVAAIVAAKKVVSQRKTVEERPQLVDPELEEEVASTLEEATEGISRRKLIGAGAAAAGVGLTAVTGATLASLGPDNVKGTIASTPWKRGVRLVDDDGEPIPVDAVNEGEFRTAFPEGADPRELGSSVVVVRINPEQIEDRRDWAVEGIMAFSKICTHAGCAVALFRYPVYEPTSQGPALVCPCHYSTFDVRKAAKVIFGPAGRPLPQLPLAADRQGNLIANGGYSGQIGPAWWGVRQT
jgi:ubiquinol-cytochrome c reductase iron-sulfur subunit